MEEQALDRLLRELGMHPDCCEKTYCEQIFQSCMASGLRGECRGMMMLPTFISADGEVPREKKILVIDAGGTNFRRAVAWFDAAGRLQLEQFEKSPMPGTQGELSVEEFFDEVAEHLLPIIHESSRIGFCFSYATKALPNMDGRLEHFCKEVQVRNSAGIEVCAELKKALRRKGVTEEKHCVLLNDSVAALLGGKAAASGTDYDSYLGYIYGTGLNCCYVEETKNIAGAEGYPGARMIVNMEAGIHVGFPMGEADRMLDASSEFPGDHMFEKMVSGAYLGRVMALTARLCAERGAFTEAGGAKLREVESFDLRDVGDFIDGSALPGLEDLCESDQAALKQIMVRLYERAAKLVAISIGCVLTWTGAGRDPARPVCVTMEGTTFRKSRIFRERFFQLARDYLNGELGVYAEFLECEDTTLTGTAIAGLLNESFL